VTIALLENPPPRRRRFIAPFILAALFCILLPLRGETSSRSDAENPSTAATIQNPAPQSAATPGTTMPLDDEAQRIYQKHGDAIYQIQVIDLASDKKTSIGSGFQFTADGLIATNYHVVAEAIQRPESNRLEYIHDKRGKGPLTILTADTRYDLAILKMEAPGTSYVELGKSKLPKGARLFSLGNPHDIGFTIVEGTYNGLSRESFIDKIHFSGAINPGMSGGPVLGHDGRVVGVNVATGGNSIGFLVPVEPLRDLMLSYLAAPEGFNFVKSADKIIEEQLLASQRENIDRLLEKPWEEMTFGPMIVPGRINEAFKCWGGAVHKDKHPYTHYRTSCSTEHRVFLDDRFNTGTYSYRYDLLDVKEDLNPLRFYGLYQEIFAAPVDMYDAFYNVREQNVSNFTCNSDYVTLGGHKWKTSFCLRRYKKYPAIHDMHLFLALLGNPRQGMVISLSAQGISKEEGLKLSRHFMTQIKPRPTPETAGDQTEAAE
jgi:S1-C subfamily serine protease